MEERRLQNSKEPVEETLEIIKARVFRDKFCLGHGNELLVKKINEYFDRDQNEETKAEICALGAAKNIAELNRILMSRLEFGTAGIRGRMGPGYANINDLTIIQTSQGFVSYVQTQHALANMKELIVIGYDGRHNSRRFAELTAVAGVNRGFKVYLFRKIVPTPFIPFACKYFPEHRKEQMIDYYGVMITASHNPKEDNGYKVYWHNGAQIISPRDRKIQEHIDNNLEPWENAWDTDGIEDRTEDPFEEISRGYYDAIRRDVFSFDANKATTLRFTYTPMHGVGEEYMREAFKVAGLPPFVSVESQKNPDPEFPTVRFPNPEEGKSALNNAIATANEAGTPIILANDPDADRLAVAEKTKAGEWRVFNGNELGALLGWWLLYVHKHGDAPIELNKCYMLSSTVSSKILQTMARKEGFNFIETLTGFKWMGNEAYAVKLAKDGVKVLFAFEEAIGFMASEAVLDKDGISAAVRLAELAIHLNNEGLTLSDQLTKIYETYGYHVSKNSYFICHDPEVIARIFLRLRKWDDQTSNEYTYPKAVLKGKYKIGGVRDLTTGYDSDQPRKKAILPASASSQMITFTFENGLTITLRTSGTEPKIKYYSELRGAPEERNWTHIEQTLNEMVEGIVTEFIEPTKHGLEPKAD